VNVGTTNESDVHVHPFKENREGAMTRRKAAKDSFSTSA
jgi:hypothetical protein